MGEKLVARAYFMINVAKEFCKSGYQDVLRDLTAIPEVQSIERLDSIFDLIVEVECPITMGFVANKMLTKEWVKRLHVLQVEPAELSKTKKNITRANEVSLPMEIKQ